MKIFSYAWRLITIWGPARSFSDGWFTIQPTQFQKLVQDKEKVESTMRTNRNAFSVCKSFLMIERNMEKRFMIEWFNSGNVRSQSEQKISPHGDYHKINLSKIETVKRYIIECIYTLFCKRLISVCAQELVRNLVDIYWACINCCTWRYVYVCYSRRILWSTAGFLYKRNTCLSHQLYSGSPIRFRNQSALLFRKQYLTFDGMCVYL